eukprot:138376-Prorocentrum_minimum.AAC.1
MASKGRKEGYWDHCEGVCVLLKGRKGLPDPMSGVPPPPRGCGGLHGKQETQGRLLGSLRRS